MNLSKINVMIDTETFNTTPDSVMISIGAVKFDQNGIHDEFFVNIDPAKSKELGMTVSKDTLNWWKTQNEETLKQSLRDAIDPKTAIEKFLFWYGGKSLHTWAKGSAFDIPIVETYIRKLGFSYPWKFWDVKCHRTVEGLLDPDKILLPKATGNLHNALVDAKLQAEHLIAMWKELNA